jgi:hypothetical protein
MDQVIPSTVATPRLQAVAAALHDRGFNLREFQEELRALGNAGLYQREDGVSQSVISNY